jgi:type IV secretion system protein VirD4
MSAATDLFKSFPRGVPGKKAREYTWPNARFADPQQLRGSPLYAWKPGKLFLGLIDAEMDGETPDHFAKGGAAIGVSDDRHICTFAGSRAGKGRSVILPNMLHYPGSVLATDPKGELATITARRRVELGQKVHVLDPFGVTEGYPGKAGLITGFNPIMAMRGERMLEDAALIADALVVVGGKDPHWDESARAFIKGVVMHVATSPDYEGRRSLITVQELISKGALKDRDDPKSGYSMDALRVDMEDNDDENADGVIISAARNFFERPPNEKGSVLSSARRHLEFVELFRSPKRPYGRMTLEKDGFRLDDLKTAPTTIYLCLPARHIGTCNRWLRLFVNLTLQSMERTVVKTLPGGVPVLCALDEFATLGHLKQIEDAAGQIAGFGCRLWTICQDMGQLKALYSDRWETFLGNSGILQFFGNNDLTTLEWISKRCGRAAIRVITNKDLTVEQVHAGSERESWSTEIYDLLTVDEAAGLFRRDDPQLRQLVLWGGRRPMVLQRAFYDTHALFRKDGKPMFDIGPMPRSE